MTDKEFCKLDSEFWGEEVDNTRQITLRTFNGQELKEYVEHCIKFNNVVLADVGNSVRQEIERRRDLIISEPDGIVREQMISNLAIDL